MRNLQGLLAFVESARLGSLSGAARKLDLTPAAVSKSVLKLESELGVRLFNRSTRRLRLTAEGEAFLQRAELVLRTLDEAVAEVSAATQTPAGKVRISVGAFFGRHWVVPALPALAARYPALQLEVDLENRPVDLVAEGVDIGIRGGIVRDSSLIARRICALPLVLVASPDYLARRGVPAEPGDLAGHDLLHFAHLRGGRVWPMSRGDARVLVPVAPRLELNDGWALRLAALEGAGICQLPGFIVGEDIRLGRLVPVLGDWQAGQVPLHAVYPDNRLIAQRVKAFVAFLARKARAEPDLTEGLT